MPAAPPPEYLVAFVFAGPFPVFGFWLAADLGDAQRRKKYAAVRVARACDWGNIGSV